MMTRFMFCVVCILLTLSALAYGNFAAHRDRDAQIRRAAKRSMMSMSKKASKTKKGKSSKKGGSGNSNGGNGGGIGGVGGVGATPNPNCATLPQSCLPGSCVADFATLASNTANGISTVLCKDVTITVTQRFPLPRAANILISCCDPCDYGCKIQLGDNVNIFDGIGAGSGSLLALAGVELNGNGFTGWAIATYGSEVVISNAIISGFTLEGSVILVVNGMLTVSDTVIEGSNAFTGVELQQSSGSFVRTTIRDNNSSYSSSGGAVTVNPNGGTVDVNFEDSTFTGNLATGVPSANDVFVLSYGTATVRCDSATETQSNGGGGVATGGTFTDQCPS